MSLNTIVGHTTQLNLIKKLIKENAFPQSSLFCGPEGIGKKLTALETLKEITKSNLNVKLLGEEKPPTIEEIREASSWLFIKPSSGKGKGIVLDRADEMKKEASNAILKTLEEPPPYGYIILIAQNENRLLPTIKSRCRIFRFGRLSEANVDYILKNLGIKINEKVLKLSGGSPGTALKLSENNTQTLIEELAALLKSSQKSKDLLKFSSNFSKLSKEEMEFFLTALENLLVEKDTFFNWMPYLKKAKLFLRNNVKPQSIIEWMLINILFKK